LLGKWQEFEAARKLLFISVASSRTAALSPADGGISAGTSVEEQSLLPKNACVQDDVATR
jgi:hypothetical protein